MKIMRGRKKRLSESDLQKENDSTSIIRRNKNKDQDNPHFSGNVEETSPTVPVNAFQFMMNSRHKVIGRNSPGKDMDLNQSDSVIESKAVKAVRRSFLENWSEIKGASKRKREYEEKGDCISIKLEKRAENLKKMLNMEEGCQSDDEVIVSRKRKCTVIQSDNESSSDIEIVEDKPNNRKHKLESFKIKLKLSQELGDKRVLRPRKPKIYIDFNDIDLDSKKKSLKMAPVFLKSIPKPKIDPEVVVARKQFLLSGLPSSIRMDVVKQQNMEERNFDVFPKISHVQQKSLENQFWILPKTDLKIAPITQTAPIQILSKFSQLLNMEIKTVVPRATPDKVTDFKKIIAEIKTQHPNLPIFKMFNAIYNKNVDLQETVNKIKPTKLKRRGRKKKQIADTSSEISDSICMKLETSNNMMWTEKYKPSHSGEIFGSFNSIKSLKDWLKTWLTLKNRKHGHNSESDFDDNSRESVKLQGNTVILHGTYGSGKSTAIYALCNELGFNVLEVNASSKRTGKWLLQELQEATQSHQVRKKSNIFTPFFQEENQVEFEKKMCVLLVEDIDLVFDQDEGFISALNQIISTSRRPIILTTTDERSPIVQKFLLQFDKISFAPISSVSLLWLQIVCLVEGFHVDLRIIERLLVDNKSDLRRTLLELQFWITSGGIIQTGPRNIETIWWNLPSLHLFDEGIEEKQKLNLLANSCDLIAFADSISDKYQFHESLERTWRTQPRDSLNLNENFILFDDNYVAEELAQILLKGNSSICNFSIRNEKRAHVKQISSLSKLEESLFKHSCLERKSIALDYLPTLRTISRFEFEQTKVRRGNRFYSYLRNFGVNFGESTYKSICNVFQPIG